MMSNGHRKINHYTFSNEDLSLTTDDNQDESFTRVAAKQRRSQPSSPPSNDAAAGRLGNLAIIESVEIHSAKASYDERDREKTPTLQRQFVRTDGRRRVSDMRESPDELQGDVTVAPAPPSLNSNCKRVTSVHRSSRRNSSEVGEDARQSLPNDIQPAIFMNPSQGQQIKGGKFQKILRKGSCRRLFKASSFRFGGIERVPSSESAAQLTVDMGHQTLELADVNEHDTVNRVTVPLQKVTRIWQGLDDSRKIQLQLSKSEGFLDERVDIEFVSQKDKADMCNLLASKGVTVQDKAR